MGSEVRYTLQSREKGSQTWETLAEGTTNPLSGGAGVGLDGVLATFDPTTHRNGIHEIRLRAEDTAGNAAEVTGCLLVDGRFKVGQSSIGGIDFNIPQLGYPLLAGRVYDSRNLDGGSFGPGWSLPHEGSNVQAEFTYQPSEGWGEDVQGGLFATYILVPRSRKILALRLGEQVFKFRMEVTPKTSFMRPIMDNYTPLTIGYVPVDETKGTLETPGTDNEVFLFSSNNGTLADGEGDEYNPTLFKLTLKDGSVYLFDKNKGLLSMTDPYGHAIAYSENGISHSSGASLSFERDTSERIERIVDDLGRTIEYRYGADGMLEQVIQKGGGSYATKVLESYAYRMGVNEVPTLKDIMAPDGTRLGTFEYDSQGRKIGLIDHEGNRVLFGYDAPEHHYTVTDRRGNPTDYTYDSDGNVTGITDAEGNSESYSYDENGYLLSKTNKLGYTTAYSYNEDGNVLTETDPLGNSVSFTYDEDGNKLTATDPLGNTTSFTYDSHGNVLTQKDALGNVTHFAYDGDGNMTGSTDALGHTTSFEYDAQGNMTGKTDPLGNSVALSYDLYGNVIRSQDEMGHVTTKEYDGQGNLVKTIDALGHETAMEYHHSGKATNYTDKTGYIVQNMFDPSGNLTENTDPTGQTFDFGYDENENQTDITTTVQTADGEETVIMKQVYDRLNRMTELIDADGFSTKAEYDALGRQTAKTDKRGNRSEVTYDPRNLITRTMSPDGHEVTNTYDAGGRLVATTNDDGNVTQYEYNVVGNVTKTTYPNGTFLEHEYDALGRMTMVVASNGLSMGYEYDAVGRLIAETDKFGRETHYEYYANGKLKKLRDFNGNVFEYEYDAQGNQTQAKFPDSTTLSKTYDTSGKVLSEIDQNGSTRYYEYDSLGKLTKYTDPAGHSTVYTYSKFGNLLSQTDANGHTTSFEYDRYGNKVKKVYPLGMFETRTYDLQSGEVLETDGNSNTASYQFDTFGRLLNITFSDNTSIAYTYTSSGQLESVTDVQGVTRYEYDEQGRFIAQTDPDGTRVAYTYDSFGRTTSVTVPSGITEYEYDVYGRLALVRDPGNNETRYTYGTNKELPSRITRPNGIVTEYRYDNFNHVIAIEHRDLSGILMAYAYSYNSKGQRVRVEEQQTGWTVEYLYDSADRLAEERIHDPLLGERVITYTYDSVGNRLEKNDNGVITTYTYDDNDRLTVSTENGIPIAFGYDDNGNMLSKVGNDETYTYHYNTRNKLTQADISMPFGDSTIEYAYDPDGIRVSKTVNGTDVTRYVVDKNRPYAQVLEEYRTQGGVSTVTNYVYGDRLLSRDTEGLSHYYHEDGFGNIRALSDASATITDTYRYDAYGQLLDKTGTIDNYYLYRGEQYDPELDAYYLRARYYHQNIGRFSSMDPLEGKIGNPNSLHRYLYGYGDPVNYTDPSGLFTIEEAQITAGIVGLLSSGGVAMWSLRDEAAAATFSDLFPDAGIVGVAGFLLPGLELRLPQLTALGVDAVKDLMELGNPSSWTFLGAISLAGGSRFLQPNLNVSLNATTIEALFSVASSQMQAYYSPSFQIELGVGSMAKDFAFPGDFTAVSSSLYHGGIFNLWNTQEYRGLSVGASLGIGNDFGINLFSSFPGWKNISSSEAWGKAPWGMTTEVATLSSTDSSTKNILSRGLSGGISLRIPLGDAADYESPYVVAGFWMLAEALMLAAATADENPTGLITSIAAYSWPMTIAYTKNVWNKYYSNINQENYSIVNRQNTMSRPPKYRSGPGHPILWFY